MIRKVVPVLGILVVPVVPAQAGDAYIGGRGIGGGSVGARTLDQYLIIPLERVAVCASPIWTGPHAWQSRWLPSPTGAAIAPGPRSSEGGRREPPTRWLWWRQVTAL